MLALIGALTILVMLALIMTKKLQTLLALIIVPIIGCLIAGYLGYIKVEEGVFNLTVMSNYINLGLSSIAPTGVMFIFAILFFGILTDAGTFDPIINGILKLVGKNPVKIAIGTVILACLVHLDGSGAVTFLIVIPAMLPLYKKLGMRATTLATLTALGSGVMNMLPWGGPTIRAITALESSVDKIFTPMIPSLVAGIIFVLLIAVYLGKKEAKRLGASLANIQLDLDTPKVEQNDLRRPKLFIFNILSIIVAVAVLISAILPPSVVFMIATVVALLVNYPNINVQKERVDSHAKSALMMASMLFAAGSFIGIMKNSGMLGAMSKELVALIPASLGHAMPAIIGVLSMPLSMVFDPDSFYYGVMPVIANAVKEFGVDPTMIARASIIGQMTTGFPISPLTGSTFLLTGLAGIDLGEHQKHTFIYAFLTTIVMLIVGIVVGAIAL